MTVGMGCFCPIKSDRRATNQGGGKFCVSIVFCEREPAVKSRRAPDESGQAPQAKYSMSKVPPQSIPLLDFCAFGGTVGLEMGKWKFSKNLLAKLCSLVVIYS